jgi:NTP pyrophosphatase (non-canonical NTP hydrolase)
MDWKEKAKVIHETVCKNWKVWSDEDRRFLALALGGEVGELQNLIKKDWRGDTNAHNLGAWREKVEMELADIRIYLELLARAYEIDLDEACEKKQVELLERWPAAAEAIRMKS